MTQWEYAELWYEQKPASVRILLQVFSIRGQEQHEFAGHEWAGLLARMGGEGWELVGVLASPTGLHQYWYYFKRPIS